MYVERVLSLNNGWTILTTQKPKEWGEAADALSRINRQALSKAIARNARINKTSSQRNSKRARASYLIYHLHGTYNKLLGERFGWSDKLPEMDSVMIDPVEPQVTKNGVLASIVGVNELTGGDFLSSLYLSIPFYYSAGAIEVSIIFIPTQDTVNRLLELGATPDSTKIPTEDTCRAELAKFNSLTSQAPIVLAFFSPTAPEEITVEEAVPLKIGEHTIERTLEFAPEYYQASVGLLAYFGKVLREKDPQTKAKVRIEQDGNIVRLHIESSSGDIETIEERLEQYALIINKQAPPESLLDNPGQIIELKAQLRIAQMQVETAHELKQLSDGRITSLEKQVEFLQTQFAAQILQTDKVIDIVGRQNDSHERVQTALLTHSGILFKDLLQEASGNQQLIEAVSSLHQNLLAGITTMEVEEQIKQALATVKQTKPGFLPRMLTEMEGAGYKAAAGGAIGAAMTWLAQHTQ